MKLDYVNAYNHSMENKNEITIRNAFPNETLKIGAYLYSLANDLKTNDAIKAFDIFNSIIDSKITKKNSLGAFKYLVYLCSQLDFVNIKYKEEAFQKYELK